MSRWINCSRSAWGNKARAGWRAGQLPELVLPSSELVQTSEMDRDQWRKEMFEGLVTAVGKTYERQRSSDSEITQFKVGDKWTAYVQPMGDFIVRNEARRTICRGNLHTYEEIVRLSEEYADELERMSVEREQSSHQSKQQMNNLYSKQFIL